MAKQQPQIPLEKRQAASRALASQKGAAGSGEFKRAYKSAMRSLQRQQAPPGKQQRGQVKGPSEKYKTVRAAAAREPNRAARKGKYTSRKADRRFKKNAASRVQGVNKLEGGAQSIQVHATFDFYGSDHRHRAVVFDLEDDEVDELNELIGETEEGGGDSVQVVADYLVNTRNAKHMNKAKVYGIEEIKVL
jgi:hypothetical protein